MTAAPQTMAAAFGMTDDQESLRSATRSALDRYAPLSVTGRTVDAPDPAQLWSALTRVGLPGMLVPEELGGAGLGQVDAAVVLHEAGRVLLPGPLLSTTLGVATVLAHAGDDLVARVLPGVAAGTTILAVAVAEDGRWTHDTPRTRAEPGPGGWSVTGAKSLVLDAGVADLLVVPADAPEGVGLFLVDARAPGCTVQPLPGLDVTRELADVRLRSASAVRLGDASGPQLIAGLLDLAVVLVAAEQVGAAQAALDLTVAHARTRVQYGRPIGSFQAVKHGCADMLIDVEYARSVADYAAWAAASGPDELPVLAGILKSVVGENVLRVTERMIQLHGGIGFTWEHVAHLYYKRALGDRLLFGEPAALQDRTATLLGL